MTSPTHQTPITLSIDDLTQTRDYHDSHQHMRAGRKESEPMSELTTNSRYTSLRSWYFKPHYFPSRAWKALRDYYHYCFSSGIPEHPNATVSRWAANDARKPWLSTTMRERYYK